MHECLQFIDEVIIGIQSYWKSLGLLECNNGKGWVYIWN